jgi:hypothetical protein
MERCIFDFSECNSACPGFARRLECFLLPGQGSMYLGVPMETVVGLPQERAVSASEITRTD